MSDLPPNGRLGDVSNPDWRASGSALKTLAGTFVSRLGLGCSQIGSLGNPMTVRASESLIRAALERGLNQFDTADIYGQGDSEAALGRVLSTRREQVFVVTKIGKRFSPIMRGLRPFKPVLKPLLARRAAGAVVARRDGAMREDFRPQALFRALAASQKRLGADWVDGLLLHSPPLETLRDGAVIEALCHIKESGRARYVGVSIETAEDLQAALLLPVVQVLQIPFALTPTVVAMLAVRPEATRPYVFAREVIRQQPTLAPEAAVAGALAISQLTGVIVGTGKLSHLDQLCRLSEAI